MVEVESSHVPMLSKPDVVIDVSARPQKQFKKIWQPMRYEPPILDRPSPGGLSFYKGPYEFWVQP